MLVTYNIGMAQIQLARNPRLPAEKHGLLAISVLRTVGPDPEWHSSAVCQKSSEKLTGKEG